MSRLVIDAHHHVWELAVTPQPWISGRWAERLTGDFTIEDYSMLARANGVSRSVLIQSVNDADETVRLLAIADDHRDLVAGVVGWADLTRADLGDQVGRLRSCRGGDRLVGLRHLAQDEPDDTWLARPDVLSSLAKLAELGLAYDLLVLPRQLPAAITAVRQVPRTRFVLDHLAKPDLTSRDLREWRPLIAELAALPNVAAKVSGLPVLASWDAWTVHDLRPALTYALEVFGPARLIFGTDWPVCTAATTYAGAVSPLREFVGRLSPADRASVLGGNAAHWYRLEAVATSWPRDVRSSSAP